MSITSSANLKGAGGAGDWQRCNLFPLSSLGVSSSLIESYTPLLAIARPDLA